MTNTSVATNSEPPAASFRMQQPNIGELSHVSRNSSARISTSAGTSGAVFSTVSATGVHAVPRESATASRQLLPAGLSMYDTPFGAMAALLDDCLEHREGNGAPCSASWDVGTRETHGLTTTLSLEYEGSSISPQQLAAALQPRVAGAGGEEGLEGASGGRSALMHALLRLGQCSTVLTKQVADGSLKPGLGVGVVVYDQQASCATASSVLPCDQGLSLRDVAGTATPEAFNPAFGAAGWASWEELERELHSMSSRGTKFIISGLWQSIDGGEELDLQSDPTDIQRHKQDALAHLLPSEKKDVGIQRCSAHCYSLRAYLSILYRTWPAGLSVVIRGTPVQPLDIRSLIIGPIVEQYRPRGVRGEVDQHGFQMQHIVAVHVGFLVDVPHTAMQGFCVYHNNRLIKPWWKVYMSASVGKGVVGYLDVDFIQPTPDWQDFERSHAFQKLEAFLKRCVPAYWKKYAATVAMPPLPPAMARLPGQHPLALPESQALVSVPLHSQHGDGSMHSMANSMALYSQGLALGAGGFPRGPLPVLHTVPLPSLYPIQGELAPWVRGSLQQEPHYPWGEAGERAGCDMSFTAVPFLSGARSPQLLPDQVQLPSTAGGMSGNNWGSALGVRSARCGSTTAAQEPVPQVVGHRLAQQAGLTGTPPPSITLPAVPSAPLHSSWPYRPPAIAATSRAFPPAAHALLRSLSADNACAASLAEGIGNSTALERQNGRDAVREALARGKGEGWEGVTALSGSPFQFPSAVAAAPPSLPALLQQLQHAVTQAGHMEAFHAQQQQLLLQRGVAGLSGLQHAQQARTHAEVQGGELEGAPLQPLQQLVGQVPARPESALQDGQLEASLLGKQAEEELAQYITRAVPEGALQQEGLELAQRIRASIERVAAMSPADPSPGVTTADSQHGAADRVEGMRQAAGGKRQRIS